MEDTEEHVDFSREKPNTGSDDDQVGFLVSAFMHHGSQKTCLIVSMRELVASALTQTIRPMQTIRIRGSTWTLHRFRRKRVDIEPLGAWNRYLSIGRANASAVSTTVTSSCGVDRTYQGDFDFRESICKTFMVHGRRKAEDLGEFLR